MMTNEIFSVLQPYVFGVTVIFCNTFVNIILPKILDDKYSLWIYSILKKVIAFNLTQYTSNNLTRPFRYNIL